VCHWVQCVGNHQEGEPDVLVSGKIPVSVSQMLEHLPLKEGMLFVISISTEDLQCNVLVLVVTARNGESDVMVRSMSKLALGELYSLLCQVSGDPNRSVNAVANLVQDLALVREDITDIDGMKSTRTVAVDALVNITDQGNDLRLIANVT
jgi:hypothetical protein